MEEQKEVIKSESKFTWRDGMQILFLILLVIAIASLISAIITIYKNKEMLMNPVGTNLENFGINYCTCFDKENKMIPIKSTNYSNVSDVFIPSQTQASQDNKELNITNLLIK